MLARCVNRWQALGHNMTAAQQAKIIRQLRKQLERTNDNLFQVRRHHKLTDSMETELCHICTENVMVLAETEATK